MPQDPRQRDGCRFTAQNITAAQEKNPFAKISDIVYELLEKAIFSSAIPPGTGRTAVSSGVPWVSVPVLSNTMVSAAANASRYFPPFTVMLWSAASRSAEITAIGAESFIAQE